MKCIAEINYLWDCMDWGMLDNDTLRLLPNTVFDPWIIMAERIETLQDTLIKLGIENASSSL